MRYLYVACRECNQCRLYDLTGIADPLDRASEADALLAEFLDEHPDHGCVSLKGAL